MNTMKKLLCCLSSLIISFSLFTVNIYALSIDNDEALVEFEEVVKDSEYYQQYKNKIKGEYTRVVNENDQLTIAYTLEEDEEHLKTLMFVGNDLYDFEQVLVVETSEENATVQDLLVNTRTRAHLGYCKQEKCVKKEPRVVWASNPGCSGVVGQACRPLKAIPGYGTITYILCRAGVYVACNSDRKIICTAWQTYEYECSTP